MSSISTKPKQEPRQIRFETIITTAMSDEEIDEFTNLVHNDFCGHIEEGRGEEAVLTVALPMDEVSDEESERLQRIYEERTDADAGAATPAATTTRRRTARR